jgi:hypothetical protein
MIPISYVEVTGFVTRVTRRVPLVEQIILPEHLSSSRLLDL